MAYVHHVTRWKEGEDSREPVARFLKTYSTYLMDHMNKEAKDEDDDEDPLPNE